MQVFSQEIEINPVDFNSTVDDFGPVITHNGRFLYFTTERDDDGQEVFFIERGGGSRWIREREAGDVNDATQSGMVAMTPDGQYMIFAAYEHDVDSEGRTDLYSARKVNGDWREITNLGPAINTDYWESMPSISSDGNLLFFASDRPGGFGGVDIYFSQRTREGWSKAASAGSLVNSREDDMSPHIAYDNSTFAFSSNRGGSVGGFDIYFTNFNNGSFSPVRNAKAPINSNFNEYTYFIEANTDIAYFSSDRPGGSGMLDIYTAIPNPHPSGPVVNVFGTVSDIVTEAPLGSDIILTDLDTGKEIANLYSDDQDGSYSVILQPGHKYSVTAEKEGYLFYSESFEIGNSKTGYNLEKDIKLSPIANGKTRLLVFFDFDKASLKNESIPELNRLISFMNKYPNIKVKLHGHTDDVGSDEYNNKLSLNRANAVKEHLTGQGIGSNRVETKGFGKREPIDPAKTDESRAKNRRVELLIFE